MACLFLLAAGPAQAGSVPPIVQKINKQRQARGLPALKHSPSLTRSSRRFGRNLMRTDRFGHGSRISASRKFRSLGEVLAFHRGWKRRRGAVVRRWLRSPAHRAVLLSPALRWMGAAAVRGRFAGRRTTIWVAQFGRM